MKLLRFVNHDMFIRTAVTFFISFKFSPIVRFIAFLLIVSLVGIRVVVIG
jgi:hypothetical protein